MTDQTEFLATLHEHRRLRLAARELWRNSPGRKYPDCMKQIMGDFWRAHPEWRPFEFKQRENDKT